MYNLVFYNFEQHKIINIETAIQDLMDVNITAKAIMRSKECGPERWHSFKE